MARLSITSRGLTANILSAAGLGFVGDLICQVGIDGRRLSVASRTTAEGDRPVDMRRVGALTLFNGVYIGAFLHYLYQGYPFVVFAGARRLPYPQLAKRMQVLDTPAHGLGCALVDFVHNNVIYIPAYFLGVGLMQGDSMSTSVDNLKNEWFTAGVTCSAFWLPFTWFNFAIVPAARRVQSMATANLLWNVVIDYLAHRGLDDP